MILYQRNLNCSKIAIISSFSEICDKSVKRLYSSEEHSMFPALLEYLQQSFPWYLRECLVGFWAPVLLWSHEYFGLLLSVWHCPCREGHSISDTIPMLPSILSTHLRDWDYRYPLLREVWYVPCRSWESERLLLKRSWYHVVSTRKHVCNLQ